MIAIRYREGGIPRRGRRLVPIGVRAYGVALISGRIIRDSPGAAHWSPGLICGYRFPRQAGWSRTAQLSRTSRLWALAVASRVCVHGNDGVQGLLALVRDLTDSKRCAYTIAIGLIGLLGLKTRRGRLSHA